MNRGSNGTSRKTACHAAKKSATDRHPSRRFRLRATKAGATCSSIGLHRYFVLERLPDCKLKVVELRGHPHFIVARPRQRDVENLLGAAGAPGHDHDAIGEIDRLLDLMGDEQD